MSIQRIDKGPRMSQAVTHGDMVFLAGQVADDTDQDVGGQTRQILDKIDALLAKAGSSKDKLLSATIWLSDIATFNEMNAIWDPWVDKENPPCRACVESKLAAPRYTVEIMVVAAR
jgi:enamine deaminase RidA (YjgF/YER057c/UK114 family)